MIKDFCKTKIFLKIKKGHFSFFVDILQLPHTVILNSEKLTHPSVYVCSLCSGACSCFRAVKISLNGILSHPSGQGYSDTLSSHTMG